MSVKYTQTSESQTSNFLVGPLGWRGLKPPPRGLAELSFYVLYMLGCKSSALDQSVFAKNSGLLGTSLVVQWLNPMLSMQEA